MKLVANTCEKVTVFFSNVPYASKKKNLYFFLFIFAIVRDLQWVHELLELVLYASFGGEGS